MCRSYIFIAVFSFFYLSQLFSDSVHNYGRDPRYFDPSKDPKYKVYSQDKPNIMGCGYAKPIGGDNLPNVKKLKRKAMEGNPDAQSKLAFCYYSGSGIEQDYQEAFKWFLSSAEQGNDVAQNFIGIQYQNAQGIEQDYQEAYRWFMKSADKCNAEAQYNLGNCFSQGLGIEQDDAKAFSWWQTSAQKSNSDAQYEVGVCYYLGRGTSKNESLAILWFLKAANQTNAKAQNYLGICYYNGLGIKKNIERAYFWWILSIQFEYWDAMQNRDLAEKELTPSQVTNLKIEAQNWLTKHDY